MYKNIKTSFKSRRLVYLLSVLVLLLFVGSAARALAQTTGELAACVKNGSVKLLGFAENVTCKSDEERFTWQIADDQTLSLVGTILSIEDGNSVDLASLQDGVEDADADPTNELNSSLSLNGTLLELTDAGGTLSADLAALQGQENGGAIQTVPQPNIVTNLVSEGTAGIDSSVAIGADGLPVISYGRINAEFTDIDLEVAKCENITCTSATVSVVDGVDLAGTDSKIVIGSDSLPFISYTDFSTDILKAAHCEDMACTTATVTTVVNERTAFNSLVIGSDGLPRISYQTDNLDLAVVTCQDVACTSSAVTIVEASTGPTNRVGEDIAIALGADGLPIISYTEASNAANDVKAAHCEVTDCSSATITVLGAGVHGDMTIGINGLPLIGYLGGTTFKMAQCTDFACTAATISNAFSIPNFTNVHSVSLHIGPDGLPMMSQVRTGNVAMLTFCSDIACTHAVSKEFVTYNQTNRGIAPSFVIGVDGLPFISHHDDVDGDLIVTHCANTFCTSYLQQEQR